MGKRKKSLEDRQVRMISALLASGFEAENVARVYGLTPDEMAALQRDPDFQALMAHRHAMNRLTDEERNARLVAGARRILEDKLRGMDLGDGPKH